MAIATATNPSPPTTMAGALGEIQGNIVPGFFKDSQDFLFVEFPDADSGRAWLAGLVDRVAQSSADAIIPQNAKYLMRREELKTANQDPHARPDPTPGEWFNLAISSAGFDKLGTPDRELLERAFHRSPWDRAEVLGDRYTAEQLAAFKQWEIGSSKDTEPDALLIVGANSAARLDEIRRELRVDQANGTFDRVKLLTAVRGQSLSEGREHFGFKDAVSQPVPKEPDLLADWSSGSPDGQVAAPGEFVLGQPTPHPATENFPYWAANGSYLVFRRFAQDREKFDQEMARQTKALSDAGESLTVSFAEKMIGRETNGTPLAADYAKDALGDQCPLFAHVRKANPRSQDPDSQKRRILRRGIPYEDHEKGEKGILFVGYQASIERQFEHVYTSWLGSSMFPKPGVAIGPGQNGALPQALTPGMDPLTGGSQFDDRELYYHRNGKGHASQDFVPLHLGRFIKANATAYFFCPSITGIRQIIHAEPAAGRSLVGSTSTENEESSVSTQVPAPPLVAADYSKIGGLIDSERPYGDKTQIPDLGNKDVISTSGQPSFAEPHEFVEVFGALAKWGIGRNGKHVAVEVSTDGKTANLMTTGDEEAEKVFHVMLPAESGWHEYRITKYVRIPYTYKAANGKDDVHANIIVLYNGVGYP